MGLFDKKKGRDDDPGSPVEELSAEELVEEPADGPARPSGRYAIEDAIALMRTLPSENVELVVQVVKHTLESARIDIAGILEEAADRERRIQARIEVLRREVAGLEREIDARRTEIGRLEGDERETRTVVERLVLAETLTRPASSAPAGEGSGAGSEERVASLGTGDHSGPPLRR